MPEVKLKKGTLTGAVEAFIAWDNDPEAREAYENLVNNWDSEIDPAPTTMAQVAFWAGVWYAKTHPEDVVIDENGSKKPDRPVAPTFV